MSGWLCIAVPRHFNGAPLLFCLEKHKSAGSARAVVLVLRFSVGLRARRFAYVTNVPSKTSHINFCTDEHSTSFSRDFFGIATFKESKV